MPQSLSSPSSDGPRRPRRIAHHGPAVLLGSLLALALLAPSAIVAAPDETAMTASDAETLHAERVAAVRAADEALNRAAGERDRETFHDLLADETVFLAGELYRGRLAVMAIWQNLFVGKYDFRYQGETLETVVARSGEFAWSVGEVRTTFQRPGLPNPDVSEGHYLHLWVPGEEEGTWRLLYNASLVVHPTLGAGRDPRSGLMTAWPELADQVDARVELGWMPESSERAASGEVAYTFGTYTASFLPVAESTASIEPEPEEGTESLGEPTVVEEAAEETEETGAAEEEEAEGAAAADNADNADTEEDRAIRGEGSYLAVWQKDAKGQWQLAGEGFTPPGIYGRN